MSWLIGISWTKGHWATTENPDKTTKELYVCSGPFYFNPKLPWWIPYFNYFYLGARPTPTWDEGYGDEGWGLTFPRWRKRHGFGNYGMALRR